MNFKAKKIIFCIFTCIVFLLSGCAEKEEPVIIKEYTSMVEEDHKTPIITVTNIERTIMKATVMDAYEIQKILPGGIKSYEWKVTVHVDNPNMTKTFFKTARGLNASSVLQELRQGDTVEVLVETKTYSSGAVISTILSIEN